MSRELTKLFCLTCQRDTDLMVDCDKGEDIRRWFCPVCGRIGRGRIAYSFHDLDGVIFIVDERSA